MYLKMIFALIQAPGVCSGHELQPLAVAQPQNSSLVLAPRALGYGGVPPLGGSWDLVLLIAGLTTRPVVFLTGLVWLRPFKGLVISPVTSSY